MLVRFCRDVKVRLWIHSLVYRFRNQYDPCMFPVGPIKIQVLVLDCIKLVGVGNLLVSAYATESILKWLVKSRVVPVMIIRREIVEETQISTGRLLIQRMAYDIICPIMHEGILLKRRVFQMACTPYLMEHICRSIPGTFLISTVVLRATCIFLRFFSKSPN